MDREETATFMTGVFLPIAFYIYVLAAGILLIASSRTHSPIPESIVNSCINMLVLVSVFGIRFYIIQHCYR